VSPFNVRPASAADLPQIGEWLGRRLAWPLALNEQRWVAESIPGDAHAPTHLLATLRLLPALGLALPRVSYHVGCTVHAAPELGLFQPQRTLLLGHDHTGASELSDIAWAHNEVPLAEQAGALRALLVGALRHIAQHRAHFANRLVVELPGPRDAAGQSPFWQGLGRYFYSGDPAAAHTTHGPEWRCHVASMLPRHVLYTAFLSSAAQAAIAHVDTPHLLLRELLEDAGLRYSHHINVEDGGPILEAEVDDLPPVRQAQQAT
jgi:arginine N-succinyltransferase